MLYLGHVVVKHRVLYLDQVQQVEESSLVLGSAVVLHDFLVELEYFFPLLVLVDQEGPPVVLIGILEEPWLFVLLVNFDFLPK